MKLNKIYCMDARKGLRLLDDRSVDLVIADPPYGDNRAYGRMRKPIRNSSATCNESGG